MEGWSAAPNTVHRCGWEQKAVLGPVQTGRVAGRWRSWRRVWRSACTEGEGVLPEDSVRVSGSPRP